MRGTKLTAASLTAAVVLSGAAWAAEEAKTEKTEKTETTKRAERAGGRAAGRMGGRWMLGMQAWTFHKDTLFEAIDKTKELGLRYMELFPGQALSPEQKDVRFDEKASDELIKKVQEKLKAAEVEAVCYGVVQLKDEASARKVFEFARKMGIKTIASEPPQDQIKMLDKLANEFEINVAIHNHPKPSHYWSPDTVLEAIKGCSKRMGACADTGHWTRSGLDPLECLKKLEGKVLDCHFKDLNAKEAKAHDVPWGSGVNKADELLKELHRQGFRGPIMIEYEHNWGKAMPEIKQCIEYFQKTVRELRGNAPGRAGRPAAEKK